MDRECVSFFDFQLFYYQKFPGKKIDCSLAAVIQIYVHLLFWDPELSRMHLHPQIQIPNAFPDGG